MCTVRVAAIKIIHVYVYVSAIVQKECQPNKKQKKISEATIHFNSDMSKSILSFFIKSDTNSAIYKTRNTGTGNGMRGMRGTRGMFTRILGNLLENSGKCCYFIIPGNVEEDSGECFRRFRGMFEKIPENVQKDSGECFRRFWGMFEKIPGNVSEDSRECSKRFRGMFPKIPGNVEEDSGECSRRFRGI